MAEDQGIVRDERGQEQPKDKMRAQNRTKAENAPEKEQGQKP